MSIDYRPAEWTAKLLIRMFDWTGGFNATSPRLFAGSARYGYAMYEVGGIRVHRETRMHSTAAMEERYGCDVRMGRLTWNQVMQRNGKLFQIETPVALIETVVDPITRRVPLTDATRGNDPMNVFWDHELRLDRLELLDFEFVGDAREYRNLVSMALLSHV